MSAPPARRKAPGRGEALPGRGAPATRRCERISDCLLDAMRAGAAPELELRGQTWAVVAAGKVYGRRKARERAEALVEAARRELKKGGGGPPPEERRRNVLLTPQRPDGEIVRYEVIPGTELLTSHRPSDFQPSRHYPEDVQERAYHLDRGERQKVIRGAQRLRVALVISRDPTATSGPPIVTERGPHGYPAMGGNGRGMMVLRAYEGQGADEYRQELLRQAADFGLDPEAVRAVRRPVLVRVLEGLPADAPRELLVAAVRRLNESLTQGLDAATLGVAQARVLTESTVRQIGEALGDGEFSLRELMAARPDLFREVLQRDQVLTPQNASEWLTAAGALTEAAKDRLEAMFLGLVLATKDRIQASAPLLLRKLERAVPALLSVRAAVPAFDLVPLLQAAADVLNDARARGLTLEDALRQQSLPGAGGALPERSPRALELARLLDASSQRAVAEAFRRWAQAAIHDPRQVLLFGSPPTPEEAFAALLGRIRNPGRLGAAPQVPCPRCSGSGRTVPWAGKINVCPSCGGSGSLSAPAPVNPRRGRRQAFKVGARVRLPYAVPVAGISADDELEVEEVGGDRYLVRALRVPKSSPVAPGAGGGRGWVDGAQLQEVVGEQLRLLNPAEEASPLPGGGRARKRGRQGNPKKKVPVLRTEATNTRQLARALRAKFGAVLPRRISVRAPAGKLRLRRKGGGAWTVWRDGKQEPELGAELGADLRRVDR